MYFTFVNEDNLVTSEGNLLIDPFLKRTLLTFENTFGGSDTAGVSNTSPAHLSPEGLPKRVWICLDLSGFVRVSGYPEVGYPDVRISNLDMSGYVQICLDMSMYRPLS